MSQQRDHAKCHKRIGAKILKTTNLTRLLQDRLFRQALDEHIVFNTRGAKATLLTPATKNAGVDFGAVGTAYDYCLRCAITRMNKGSHDIIKSFQAIKHYSLRYHGVPRVRKQMGSHLDILEKYLDRSLITADELFKACLFLAKFDAEYKSGLAIEQFDVKPQNITELKRVVEGSNLKWLAGKSSVIGPLFDCAGTDLKINADGDLIIGKILLDIKTSPRLALKEDFRQLIGYYVLNGIAGKPFDIENIGIYYPRFDYFVERPISEFVSESAVTSIESLFKSKLGGDIKYDASRNLQYGISQKPIEAILTDEAGRTLLHHSAIKCDRQRVAELIKIGADINAKDLEGRTPLFYALNKKNTDFLEFLIRSGANVNVSDITMMSPLLWAVTKRDLTLIKILLNAGADVNYQGEEGWTSLHYAVSDKQKKIIKLLMGSGADIHIREMEGLTPLAMASNYPKDKLVDLLQQH